MAIVNIGSNKVNIPIPEEGQIFKIRGGTGNYQYGIRQNGQILAITDYKPVGGEQEFLLGDIGAAASAMQGKKVNTGQMYLQGLNINPRQGIIGGETTMTNIQPQIAKLGGFAKGELTGVLGQPSPTTPTPTPATSLFGQTAPAQQIGAAGVAAQQAAGTIQTSAQAAGVTTKPTFDIQGNIIMPDGQKISPQDTATYNAIIQQNQLTPPSIQAAGITATQKYGDILTLPSGQRIDPRDPNYDQYAQSLGITSPQGVLDTGAIQTAKAETGVTTAGAAEVDMAGWTPQMKALYEQMQTYLADLQAKGKTINPNVDITPEMSQKFLDQAKQELGPYYSQLFKQAQEDITRDFKRETEDYATRQRKLASEFAQSQEQTQEAYARRGLNISSMRTQAEQQLGEQARQAQEANIQQAQRAAEDVGIKGERYLGSQFFPQTQMAFQIGGAPTVGRPGQYGFTGGAQSRQLFTPQGGVTGGLERERLTEEERRRRELETTERSFRGTLYG